MKCVKNLIFVFALLGLGACSTTQVPLTYVAQPSATIAPSAKPVLTVGTVTDSREHQTTRLGSIRGGFGNPIKVLESDQPVDAVIQKAFLDGLAATGLKAAGDPKYTLNIDIKRFDCNQFARREAHIVFDMSLIDAESQKTIYQKTIKADKVTGGMITFDAGIFASVEDLRQVMNDDLQQAVDQLLSDPAFNAVLRE